MNSAVNCSSADSGARSDSSWWRHQMETFSALLAIYINSPVPGEFPAQRPGPVTRSFHVFFDLHQNKPLSKQSWGWWFETPPHPLWRHFFLFLVWYFKTCKQPISLNNVHKLNENGDGGIDDVKSSLGILLLMAIYRIIQCGSVITRPNVLQNPRNMHRIARPRAKLKLWLTFRWSLCSDVCDIFSYWIAL